MKFLGLDDDLARTLCFLYALRDARDNSVPQEWGFPSWFKLNEGAIGPPIAHTVAAAGAVSAAGLAYFLESLGYLFRNWGAVLIAAGYVILLL